MLQTIKKILYLLPAGDRFKIFIIFLMMLLGAFLEIIGIGIIPVFVSIVASPDTILKIEWLKPVWDIFNIESGGDLLVYGAICLIAVFFAKNAYIVFYQYTQSRFIWGRFAVIGGELFKRYMYAPYEFHLMRNSSELLRNVTREAQYVAQNVLLSFLKLAMDVILIAGICAMLLLIEPVITLIVIVLLGGGAALFLRLIRKKLSKYGLTAQQDRGHMITSVNEGLGGIKDARVLNREQWFFKRFFYHIRRYSKSQVFRQVSSSANKPVIETIAVSGMLLIMLILYWQGRGLDSVIPLMALFGVATLRLMPAIREMTAQVANLRYYIYSVDPIYDDTIKLSSEKVVNREKNTEILKFEKEIRFEGVKYSYPGSDIQAVNEISLAIPRDYSVGIVGTSGAGKTTLVDLLLGLLIPQNGIITVDDTDIHTNISGWQRNIGYIPQFIFLADDTIRRNISFGLSDEEVEDNKLRNAIEAAQLSELVNSLPRGVETIIGERGTRLSGGQRQRIGIARALYHKPQLLIMDEATSALDSVTEKYVVEAIERLKGERTIIMIAHRLTTVEKCDMLYLMHHGSIVDSGSYEVLIERNRDFRKMALSFTE